MSSSGSSINGEGGEASGRNVVALFSSGNRLGISHYCEEMNCVSTDGVSMGLEETEDLMQFIKRSLQPSLFLLHPRIACNAPLLRAITDSMDSAPDYYPYKVVKSAAWNPHTAMDLLTNRLIVKDLCASGVDRFACSSGSEKYMLFASGYGVCSFYVYMYNVSTFISHRPRQPRERRFPGSHPELPAGQRHES